MSDNLIRQHCVRLMQKTENQKIKATDCDYCEQDDGMWHPNEYNCICVSCHAVQRIDGMHTRSAIWQPAVVL